jgi:hypothetical protein
MPDAASVAVLPITGAHFLSESTLRAPQPLHERLSSPTGNTEITPAISLQSVNVNYYRFLYMRSRLQADSSPAVRC